MQKNILFLIVCFFIKTSLFASNLLVPGSLTHENKVVLTQEIEGSIPIQNESDKPITVKVSLSDYSFNSKGESLFSSMGSNPRSNSSWIQTNKMLFEIAPHSTYSFAYTLKVPNEKSLSGTYWSIFLIEPVEASLQSPDKKQSLGVQTIIRYGVQIITHVGDSGTCDLKILTKQIIKENAKKFFSLQVENPGTRSLSPVMSIELVDLSGKKIGRFETVKQRILPTCSVSYQVDLSTVVDGKYKAMVFLDNGDNAFFGAQYDLTLD